MVKIKYVRQPRDAFEETYNVSAGGSVTIADLTDTSVWGGLIVVFERLEVSNKSGAMATVTLKKSNNNIRTVVVPNGETVDIAPEVAEAGDKLDITSDQAITVNVVKAVIPKDLVSFEVTTE